MSIYSWSIGHILEHEFFCLGCLGWAGSKEKKVDLSFSGQLLRVFFPTFWGQKKWFFFENIVESFHIFLVFLMISFTYLFAAEPLNFLYCSTFEIICCCWTFEIMPWIMYLFTAEPLDFFYCWTFEIMPWIMYLFDAEALRMFSSKQNHQKSGPLIKCHESEITDISIIPAKISKR